MKKSDLVTGMIVECANGNLYFVMKDTCMAEYPAIFKNLDAPTYLDMEHFNDDLTTTGNPVFNVMKVYNPVTPSNFYEKELYELLWSRL